jgi:hypothetical protein
MCVAQSTRRSSRHVSQASPLLPLPPWDQSQFIKILFCLSVTKPLRHAFSSAVVRKPSAHAAARQRSCLPPFVRAITLWTDPCATRISTHYLQERWQSTSSSLRRPWRDRCGFNCGALDNLIFVIFCLHEYVVQGCDRHIMGWRVAASSLGMQVPLFSNPLLAISTDFRLSTSNVPTKGLGEPYVACYATWHVTSDV